MRLVLIAHADFDSDPNAANEYLALLEQGLSETKRAAKLMGAMDAVNHLSGFRFAIADIDGKGIAFHAVQ